MLKSSTVIAHASNTRDAVAMWLSVRLRSVSTVRNQLLVHAAKVSESELLPSVKKGIHPPILSSLLRANKCYTRVVFATEWLMHSYTKHIHLQKK